jgi:hypothetical protein
MRSAKCEPDLRESAISLEKKLKKMRGARSMAKKVRNVDAARMLVDLVY